MPQPNEQLDQEQELANQESNQLAPTTPTIDNSREVFQQVLRDAQAREAAQIQRIRELEDKLSTPAPVVNNQPPVTDDQFWQNPAQNLNQMISRQVSPLLDFVEEQKKRDAYAALKIHYRSYDGFNQIEGYVDRFMNGREANHANMQEAIRQAIGQMVIDGKFPVANTAPAATPVNQEVQNQNQNQNQNTQRAQAHLRPTNNTPVTPQNNAPQRRPLTENERKLMREWGQTEEQFWAGMEADTRVSTWAKPGAK